MHSPEECLARIKRGETLGYPPFLRVRQPGIVRSTRDGQHSDWRYVYVRDPHQAPASTSGRTTAAEGRPRRTVLGAEQTAPRRSGSSLVSRTFALESDGYTRSSVKSPGRAS